MKLDRPREPSRGVLSAVFLSFAALGAGSPDHGEVQAAPIREPSVVTVAPGGLDGSTLAASSCPTFLWGSASRSERLELVIYRVVEGQAGEAGLETTLTVDLDGRSPGWTPARPECLERGGRYAWSVRPIEDGAVDEGAVEDGAADDDVSGAWAPVRWFEVAVEPSADEIEAVVAHLAARERDRRAAANSRVASIAAVVPTEPAGEPRAPLERTARAAHGSGRFSVSGSGDLGVAGDVLLADDTSHVVEISPRSGTDLAGRDLAIRAGDASVAGSSPRAGGDLTIEAGAGDNSAFNSTRAGDLVLRGGTNRGSTALVGGNVFLQVGGVEGGFQTVLSLVQDRSAVVASGSYLRLAGSVTPPVSCASSVRGSLFYDTSKQDLCLCNDTDTWVGVTKAGTCN